MFDKRDITKKLIKSQGGIAKTSDFDGSGVSSFDVARFCKEGFLIRLKHGYYSLADEEPIYEEKLLFHLLSEAVICLESALFHYGYSDFTPRRWSVAVPRDYSRSKLNSCPVPLKPYFVKSEYLSLGKSEGDFNGVTLSVYDRERTVVDCFRYRNKLDKETFIKAIKAYVDDDNKNLMILSEYAKKLHVYDKIIGTMEILLNER